MYMFRGGSVMSKQNEYPNFYARDGYGSIKLEHINLVLLCDSLQFGDEGGWIYNQELHSSGNTDITKNRYAVNMTGGTVVTIGGNYNYPNITYEGTWVQGAVSGIKYSGDGMVNFTSQTGAGSGTQKDEEIFISVSNATSSRNPLMNTKPVPVQDISAYGIMAEQTLTVLSDMAAAISVDSGISRSNLMSSYRTTTVSNGETKVTYHSLAGGNVVETAGLKAAGVVLNHSFTGGIHSGASIVIKCCENPSVSGNTVSAAGILTDGSVSQKSGDWDGVIYAVAGDIEFDAHQDHSVNSPEKGFADASVQNNAVSAYGIKAGSVGINDFTGEIAAVVSTVKFIAASREEKDPTVTLSGNSVTAVGISAANINIAGDMQGDVLAMTSGITHEVDVLIPGITKETYSSNSINTYGLKADEKISVSGNMAGAITVGGKSLSAYSNLTLNGVAAPTLEVGKNLTSEINVSGSGLNIRTDQNDTSGTGNIVATGIDVDNITVNGYLAPTVNMSITSGVITAVAASTIKAQAFTGNITNSRGTGISFTKAMSNFADCVFTIAGDITAQTALKSGLEAINLRISGKIQSSSVVTVGDVANADFLYLAAGADVTGTVDLRTLENQVIIDSNARFHGSLEASGGEIDLTFMLNDKAMSNVAAANDQAVITGDHLDMGSTVSVTVNLNDVELNGQESKTYHLVGAVESDWSNRIIAFSYQDKIDSVRVGETTTLGGLTVTSRFDAQKGLFVDVSGSKEANKYAAPEIVKAEARPDGSSIRLEWSKDSSATAYELEYRINGGNTVVVMLKDNKYDLTALEENQKVEFRVRTHNKLYNVFSDWSAETTVNTPQLSHSRTIDVSQVTAWVKNPDNDSKTASPALELLWDDFVLNADLDHYEVRYCVLTPDEKENGGYVTIDKNSGEQTVNWDKIPAEKIFSKTTTADEILISGLNNSEYVYWQVRAVDEYGTVSSWVNGIDLKFLYNSDTQPPVINSFKVNTLEYVLSKDLLALDLAWNATEENGGSGLSEFFVRYREHKSDGTYGSWSDHIRLDAAKYGTGYSLELPKGHYEVELYAKDVAGNTSEHKKINVEITKDVPSFGENPEFLYAERTNENKLDFQWSAAVSDDSFPLYKHELVITADTNDDGVEEEIFRKAYSFQTTDASISAIQNGVDLTALDKFSWHVEAFDIFGDVTRGETQIIGNDTVAPTGSFQSDSKTTVDCTWKTPVVVTPDDSTSGNTGDDNNLSSGGTETAAMSRATVSADGNYISDIKVTLDFNANFKDDSGKVRYQVQICDNQNFTGSNLKTFYTDTTELIFDDGTADGHVNAGELLGMKNNSFYWRVRAIDNAGNASLAWFNGNNGQVVKLQDETTAGGVTTVMNITDNAAPEVPASTNLFYGYDKNIFLCNWDAIPDAFGVKYYTVTLESKTSYGKNFQMTEPGLLDTGYGNVAEIKKSGKKYIIKTLDDSPHFLLNVIPDGEYTISVKATDYAGNSSENIPFDNKETGEETFLIDTVAPVLDASAVKVQVAGNDACITWKSAMDTIGIEKYDLIYSKRNKDGFYEAVQTITVDAKATSYTMHNLAYGDYMFSLKAHDSRNASEQHDVTFSITTVDAGNSYAAATSMKPGDEYNDALTSADTSDYYSLNMEKNGIANISLKDIATLGTTRNAGVKMTIYNSALKRVKSVSVKKAAADYSYLLNQGKYYIVFTPGKKNVSISYSVTVTPDYFPAPTTNDSAAMFKARTLKSTALENSSSGKTAIADLSGWVGFGDADDYYMITGTRSAKTTISISGITAKCTAVIYNESGKKIKSTKLSAGKVFSYAGYLGGKYFISITSGDKGKGKQNTYYNVDIDSVYVAPDETANNAFADADKTARKLEKTNQISGWVGIGDVSDVFKFTNNSGAGTSFEVKGVTGKLKLTIYNANRKKVKSVTVSKNGTFLANTLVDGDFYVEVASADKGKKQHSNFDITLNANIFPVDASPNDSFSHADAAAQKLAATNQIADWVGFGDICDMFKFTNSSGASTSFEVKGVTGKLKLTIYDANRKKIKSVTVSKDGTYLAGTLIDGNFYVEVASADKGKKQHSNFDIKLNANIFPDEKFSNNRIARATSLNNAADGVVSPWDGTTASIDDWVGFGDEGDFFTFETDRSGRIDLDLALDSPASCPPDKIQVQLYDANGQALALDAALDSVDILSAGKYFVSVETANEKKYSSGYKLDITLC